MLEQPLIIAHRGASAYLPEHTSESKALAHGQGADFIEQDVVATRDGALLVLHDIFLDCVTDVAQQFPARRRDDGHYYAIDFTLDEIRRLRVHERMQRNGKLPRYANRFPVGRGNFRISTLEEEIELIQGLNFSTGRTVGLYPEIKNPSWHTAHGIDLGAMVLQCLESFGYQSADDPVYVQCFDSAEVKRLRHDLGTRLRLVQLLEDNIGYEEMITRARLEAVAGTVDAIGLPLRRMIRPSEGRIHSPVPSAAVTLAQELELPVHAYTFRREDLLPGIANLEEQLRLFMSVFRVKGVFCDHPDVAVSVRSAL